jgi:hypothetical protein
LQNITCEAEQATGPLGLDHLVGGEPEFVQVIDQAGSAPGIRDPGGFQRIEIGHHPSLPASTPRLGWIPVRTPR